MYTTPTPCCIGNVNLHQINDALLRTLEAEREGKPIPVDDGDATTSAGAAPLLDLGGGSDDPLQGKVQQYLSLHNETAIDVFCVPCIVLCVASKYTTALGERSPTSCTYIRLFNVP